MKNFDAFKQHGDVIWNIAIRHYLYQDIDGLALDALDNTNVETIS